MSKGGARAAAGRRALTRAALVSLVLMVNGCAGCKSCADGSQRLMTWNKPKCGFGHRCEGVLACPPEEKPICELYREGLGGFCVCDPVRWVENPDGGEPHLALCVHNPDGGAPVCGKWDGNRGVMLGEDGRVIWDKNGGLR